MFFIYFHSKASKIYLSGGNVPSEGTINVLHNGVWGSVCSTSFDTNDARVVCAMLGYLTRLDYCMIENK